MRIIIRTMKSKVAVVVVSSLIFTACSGNSSLSTDKYVGSWVGSSSMIGDFNITKDGDTYNFSLAKTIQSLSYCSTAKKVGEKLMCNTGVIVKYDAKDDTLHLDFGARKEVLTRAK